MEINGIAHIILTVSDWEKQAPFYRKLLSFLGLNCVFDRRTGYSQGDGPFLYYVGGRTAIGIMEASEDQKKDRFNQKRVGLHHLCLRAKERRDIDVLHAYLEKTVIPEHGGHVVQAPKEGPWAPGYYSLLFEDPDGIRIEINYVPGKGLLGLQQKQLFSKL